MIIWVFAYGIALTMLGLGFYVGTGQDSPTALIPAVLGVLILVIGSLCGISRFRARGMHAVTALAVLGMLGGVPGLIALLQGFAGGRVDLPYAALEQTLLVVFSSAFFTQSLKSFVVARRARGVQ